MGSSAVPAGYDDPVLVSSTDGVGTKLKVAEAAGRFDTIGIDLVAMCVDDVAVQGADPLFFLDYVGVGRLDPAVVEAIVAGVAEGCRQAGCALVGGEVAEHGAGHSMDLAGFCVGVAEPRRAGDRRRRAAGRRARRPGLARPAVERLQLAAVPCSGTAPDDPGLVDELLRPSVIYSPRMAALRRAVAVHGFAHITGGGLPGNLVRVLPAGCDAVVQRGSWPVPPIFERDPPARRHPRRRDGARVQPRDRHGGGGGRRGRPPCRRRAGRRLSWWARSFPARVGSS